MGKKAVYFFILLILSVGLVCAVFYGTSRTFSPNSEPYDINTPGDYQVLIKVFGLTNFRLWGKSKCLPFIFLWDDAKLMKYSSSHGNSHNYDHEVYNYVK